MGLPRKKIILAGILFLVLFLIIISVLGVMNSGEKPNLLKRIKINDKIITVELVLDPYSQYLGLSDRASLCDNCGMLFIFSEKQKAEFVMRDMNFPLDLLFIVNNRIVEINRNLMPEGKQPINNYQSFEPINMALELPGGYCQQNNIQIGDQVDFYNGN